MGVPASLGFVETTPGELISPDIGSVTTGASGAGLVKPGLRMSPAYAGTLRAKARIAAVQIALRVFMVFSSSVFLFGKAVGARRWDATAWVFNEADHSRLLTRMQGFLYRLLRGRNSTGS